MSRARQILENIGRYGLGAPKAQRASFQADSFQVPWDAAGPANYRGDVIKTTKDSVWIKVTHGPKISQGQVIRISRDEPTLRLQPTS